MGILALIHAPVIAEKAEIWLGKLKMWGIRWESQLKKYKYYSEK